MTWTRMIVALAAMGYCAAFGGELKAEDGTIPLRLLYLSRQDDAERTVAFQQFLSAKFLGCVTVKRNDFRPALLEDADVVLLDWSQQERGGGDYPSPIGPLEEWSTPLVLLGSAGHLLAGPWSVIGGAG